MRKSKFTKSQKLEVLAKWDAGAKIDDLCREYQISTATLVTVRATPSCPPPIRTRALPRTKAVSYAPPPRSHPSIPPRAIA
ncbi:transposase [Neolewinella persica]|uniref:transposase n=1 Tax=Neolewinella persica TaxID=70998 RepID=UPI0038739BB5